MMLELNPTLRLSIIRLVVCGAFAPWMLGSFIAPLAAHMLDWLGLRINTSDIRSISDAQTKSDYCIVVGIVTRLRGRYGKVVS